MMGVMVRVPQGLCKGAALGLTQEIANGSLSGNTDYTTHYIYDAADEQTGETDPAGNDFSFFYDDRGNLRGTQYPNGTFSWVDTDPDGDISAKENLRTLRADSSRLGQCSAMAP
jgi:YD repeat-containing protein